MAQVRRLFMAGLIAAFLPVGLAAPVSAARNADKQPDMDRGSLRLHGALDHARYATARHEIPCTMRDVVVGEGGKFS